VPDDALRAGHWRDGLRRITSSASADRRSAEVSDYGYKILKTG